MAHFSLNARRLAGAAIALVATVNAQGATQTWNINSAALTTTACTAGLAQPTGLNGTYDDLWGTTWQVNCGQDTSGGYVAYGGTNSGGLQACFHGCNKMVGCIAFYFAGTVSGSTTGTGYCFYKRAPAGYFLPDTTNTYTNPTNAATTYEHYAGATMISNGSPYNPCPFYDGQEYTDATGYVWQVNCLSDNSGTTFTGTPPTFANITDCMAGCAANVNCTSLSFVDNGGSDSVAGVAHGICYYKSGSPGALKAVSTANVARLVGAASTVSITYSPTYSINYPPTTTTTPTGSRSSAAFSSSVSSALSSASSASSSASSLLSSAVSSASSSVGASSSSAQSSAASSAYSAASSASSASAALSSSLSSAVAANPSASSSLISSLSSALSSASSASSSLASSASSAASSSSLAAVASSQSSALFSSAASSSSASSSSTPSLLSSAFSSASSASSTASSLSSASSAASSLASSVSSALSLVSPSTSLAASSSSSASCYSALPSPSAPVCNPTTNNNFTVISGCNYNYTIYCGFDTSATDLSNTQTSSIAACIQACEASSSCTAATWVRGSPGTCYLKSGFKSLNNPNAANVAIVRYIPPNPTFAVPILAPGVNTSSGCGTALAAGLSPGGTTVALNFTSPDGYVRNYTIHIPQYYDINHASPLIFGFPGNGDNAAGIESQTTFSNAQVNPYGIAVYINGVGLGFESNPGWGPTVGSTYPNVDDVGFLNTFIDYLTQNYCVDLGRIWAAGHSNGGGFTGVLSCDPVLSSRISVFAASSGAFYTNLTSGDPFQVATGNPIRANCVPANPNLPYLEFHGTADATINYSGGSRNGRILPAITHWTQNWAARNGWGTTNVSTTPYTGATMYQFGGRGSLGRVTQITIAGWPHQYPTIAGGAPFDGGPVMMQFFYDQTNLSRVAPDGPAISASSSSLSSTATTISSIPSSRASSLSSVSSSSYSSVLSSLPSVGSSLSSALSSASSSRSSTASAGSSSSSPSVASSTSSVQSSSPPSNSISSSSLSSASSSRSSLSSTGSSSSLYPLSSNPSTTPGVSSSSLTVNSASATATVISPDGTCGGNNGYTCAGSVFGSCCSLYGYCGSTSDFCCLGGNSQCNTQAGTCWAATDGRCTGITSMSSSALSSMLSSMSSVASSISSSRSSSSSSSTSSASSTALAFTTSSLRPSSSSGAPSVASSISSVQGSASSVASPSSTAQSSSSASPFASSTSSAQSSLSLSGSISSSSLSSVAQSSSSLPSSISSSSLSSVGSSLSSALSSASSALSSLSSSLPLSSTLIASPTPSYATMPARSASCPANDEAYVQDDCGVLYVISCGNDTLYGSGDFVYAATFNDCFDLCSSGTDGACTAFTWDSRAPACYFKNYANEGFTAPGSTLVAAIQVAYYGSDTPQPPASVSRACSASSSSFSSTASNSITSTMVLPVSSSVPAVQSSSTTPSLESSSTLALESSLTLAPESSSTFAPEFSSMPAVQSSSTPAVQSSSAPVSSSDVAVPGGSSSAIAVGSSTVSQPAPASSSPATTTRATAYTYSTGVVYSLPPSSSTTEVTTATTTYPPAPACPTETSQICGDPNQASLGESTCSSNTGQSYSVNCGVAYVGTEVPANSVVYPSSTSTRKRFTFTAPSFEYCQETCDLTPNCTAVNYVGGNCTLFSEVTGYEYVPDAITAQQVPNPPPEVFSTSTTPTQYATTTVISTAEQSAPMVSNTSVESVPTSSSSAIPTSSSMTLSNSAGEGTSSPATVSLTSTSETVSSQSSGITNVAVAPLSSSSSAVVLSASSSPTVNSQSSGVTSVAVIPITSSSSVVVSPASSSSTAKSQSSGVMSVTVTPLPSSSSGVVLPASSSVTINSQSTGASSVTVTPSPSSSAPGMVASSSPQPNGQSSNSPDTISKGASGSPTLASTISAGPTSTITSSTSGSSPSASLCPAYDGINYTVSSGGSYSVECDTAFSGTRLSNQRARQAGYTTTPDTASCLATCNENDACVAINITPTDCEYFSSVSDTSSSPGTVALRKFQRAVSSVPGLVTVTVCAARSQTTTVFTTETLTTCSASQSCSATSDAGTRMRGRDL